MVGPDSPGRVYIRNQSDVIPLSTHVWLWMPEKI
jgi:hypothetical protein